MKTVRLVVLERGYYRNHLYPAIQRMERWVRNEDGSLSIQYEVDEVGYPVYVCDNKSQSRLVFKVGCNR